MTDSKQQLTDLQLELLGVLWGRSEASTSEVQEALEPERELALSTVATLLARLEKRGIVTHRRVGRQYVYRPLVTRGAVRRARVRELMASLFDGDPAALVSHLVSSDEVNVLELQRIREMLDQPE